jgi:hypothetical protein
MTSPTQRDGSAGIQARQQVLLWMMAGDQACLQRAFIRGLHYYQRALTLAQSARLKDLEARVCRDLAYVYLHSGASAKGLALAHQGLSLAPGDPEVELGLYVNQAGAYLTLHDFPRCHDALRTALRRFEEHYPRLRGASFRMVATMAGLVKMERQVRRVVDLLESGVNPERIQVVIELARPYWLPAERS